MYCLLFITVFTSNPVPLSESAQLKQFSDKLDADIIQILADAKINIAINNKRHQASVEIRKLARLRAKVAIPFLIDNLAFNPLKDDFSITPIPTLETALPCVYALSEIGPPAFEPLLKMIVKEKSEESHKYAAYVFVHSLGEEYAKNYITHYSKTKVKKDEKTRLNAIIDNINMNGKYK